MLGNTRSIRCITAAACLVMATPGRARAQAGDTVRQVGRVECPHSWNAWFGGRGKYDYDMVVAGQAALAGPITNIAEMADCQRFLLAGAKSVFDSIQAVWAAVDLRSRFTEIEKGRGRSASRNAAWAVAEFYSEGPYEPLGLGLNGYFSCLYVFYGGDQLVARMVSFEGGAEADCREAIRPATAVGGTPLDVRRTPADPDAKDSHPQVARWDWDAGRVFARAGVTYRGVQYVGLACGDDWCEYGPTGFNPSPLPVDPAAGTRPANWASVSRFKGRFDAQRLAQPQAAAAFAGAVPKPSPAGSAARPLFGVAYPDPALGTYTLADLDRQWKPVSWIALNGPEVGYKAKLGLDPNTPTTATQINRVFFCNGRVDVCMNAAKTGANPLLPAGVSLPAKPVCAANLDYGGVLVADRDMWWAAIVAADKKVTFKCVLRRDHKGELGHTDIKIPATVRWRWREADDLEWVYCIAYGCCEVEG